MVLITSITTFVVIAAGVTIFVTSEAYAKCPKAKKLRKGIILTVVLMCLIVMGGIGVILAAY